MIFFCFSPFVELKKSSQIKPKSTLEWQHCVLLTHISFFQVNLDPAVANLPYEPNIDIRDTVNYKEVMKQYGLGPNGGL